MAAMKLKAILDLVLETMRCTAASRTGVDFGMRQ